MPPNGHTRNLLSTAAVRNRPTSRPCINALRSRSFLACDLYGYSIGHYEGDTLVIETRHLKGWESERNQRWLDRLGHPFSDELRLVERIRRVDHEKLEIEITIDDPIAYTRPWTGILTFRLRDFELAESICQELMLSDLPEMRPGQE